MVEIIKRLILRAFPELSAGYHLPLFAEVVGVRETPAAGDVCNDFRPFYAVDVQILDEHGKPDKKWSVLKDVVLSLPVAGHEMGQFAYPENGTWVEIAFAYGSPNRPFIRSVLPHGLTLPDIERGEQRWQKNAEVFQSVDKDSNWQRQTDQQITDKSLTRLVEAMDVVENFHKSVKNTETNDTEIIGAIKRIEAFGAVVVQAGGVLDLSAIDSIRLTTKANMIIRVLADMQTAIDGDMNNQVTGSVAYFADVGQHFESPKTWIGSSAENAIALISEVAQLVVDLATTLSTHTHPTVGQIAEAAAVVAVGTNASAVKARVDSIAE